MSKLMEKGIVKQLDRIDSPLPNGELDEVLAQLDMISGQLESPNTAGERAIHVAEQWGWHRYLKNLGRTPHLPPTEQIRSAGKLVDYFCAIKSSGGINQYSPRALREYFLNAHLQGMLLVTVDESVARRTNPTQQ
jgi:hypothetical protein